VRVNPCVVARLAEPPRWFGACDARCPAGQCPQGLHQLVHQVAFGLIESVRGHLCKICCTANNAILANIRPDGHIRCSQNIALSAFQALVELPNHDRRPLSSGTGLH